MNISNLTGWIQSGPNWVVALVLSGMTAGALFAEGGMLASLILIAAVGLIVIRYWSAMKTLDFRVVVQWLRAQFSTIFIRDWYSPSQAAEFFCDPAVVREWHEARARISTSIMEMVREQGRKVGDSAGAYPLHAVETPMPGQLIGQPPGLHGGQEAAQDRYKQCDRLLRHELVRQLTSGALVAKGSPVDGDDHLFERAIPSSLWRGLKLDIRNSEAFGEGRRYGAISIGKRRSAWAVWK